MNSRFHTDLSSRRILTEVCLLVGLLGAALIFPGILRAAGTVTSCDEASLRAAMTDGGTVTFASDGTILLANTITVANDTVLDASGHNVVISGNNAVRLFAVGTDVNCLLKSLTLADGIAVGALGYPGWADPRYDGIGAAVCNTGRLQIVQCVLSNHCARGESADKGKGCEGTAGRGGAIYNLGELMVSNCVFTGNRVLGGTGGSEQAPGGRGLSGGAAAGGGIFNQGTATIALSQFVGNTAVGGQGGVGQSNPYGGGSSGGIGGMAQGAAICNNGTALITRCTFANGAACGGDGGVPGTPGFAQPFQPGGPGGDGRVGGAAAGGAVFNLGWASVVGCTFFSNSVTGAKAGSGGEGQGAFSAGAGGAGGAGGDAQGAAIASFGGELSLTNCTLAANSAVGGAGAPGGNGGATPAFQPSMGGNGGNGGNGGAVSGAFFSSNSLVVLTCCTLGDNAVVPGLGGAVGLASCGYRYGCGVSGKPGTNGPVGGTALAGLGGGSLHLLNSIVAGGSSAANCSGAVRDEGCNLCSDDSAALSAKGSINRTDPKLVPLANNGGPTMTLALMPDSPAVDTGILAGVTADQRGVDRPYGAAPDIGAYEWNAMTFYSFFKLSLPVATNGEYKVRLLGPPGAVVRLQGSIDLSHWSDLATNMLDSRGAALVQDREPITGQRFYRTVSP